MAVMQENFARCTECGGGWFVVKDAVLIAKASDFETPVVIDTSKVYACEKCGHIQYRKKGSE